MWNGSEAREPPVFPLSSQANIQLFTLEYDDSCQFFKNILYHVEQVSTIPAFFLIMKCWDLASVFSIY
jgi:hypothetical protein